ncbi:MAG: hypothetical protein HZA10_09335 [Nitrospirae bacterium]|nr:hypothetical protein [Nitrospirota bacterium]
MNLKELSRKVKYFFSISEGNYEQDQLGYFHWYEKDPKRLKWEAAMMNALFPQLILLRLRDGRLAYRGSVNGKDIALVFPYLYPIEPPQVAVFKEKVQGDDPDSFYTGFIWQTNMSAVDILRGIQPN